MSKTDSPFFILALPQQRMSQAWGLFCTGTSITATQSQPKPQIINIRREQLVPSWADAELCWDVLVEMICLLWGSREDVEKSAHSQLLQGVLQCRGLTLKQDGRRQIVQCSAAHSLPPFAPLPRLFPSSLFSSLTSVCSPTISSLFLLCYLSPTQTHSKRWSCSGP